MSTSNHVFISFKTEERNFAQVLKNALVNSGFKVWWQEDLQCGHEWHGEIDKAIEEAAAIVVLWSGKSVNSEWVKHEASQAISKKIYTPVKIEKVDLESPYDRIQAADLIGWYDDRNNPGYRSLVLRLEQLLPKLSLRKKLSKSIHSYRLFLGLLLLIIVVLIFFWNQRSILEMQTKKQQEIASNTERSLQPIEDFDVSVTIIIDSTIPEVKTYSSFVHSQLKEINKNPTQLPIGVGKSRFSKPGEFFFTNASELWPSSDENSLLYYLFNYADLWLEFRTPENSSKNYSDQNFGDLVIPVSSWDSTRSINGKPNSCQLWYDINTKRLDLRFSYSPAKKFWQSTGKILSVPDLENSNLSVRFMNLLVKNTQDQESSNEILNSRSKLKLSDLFIFYSGKELHFYGNKMKKETTLQSLPVYTTNVKEGIQH